MITVGAFEAKTRLSALLELVEKGEEVLITRRGKPVAKLARAVPADERADVKAAIEELRALRAKIGPIGAGWRELRDEGRKY